MRRRRHRRNKSRRGMRYNRRHRVSHRRSRRNRGRGKYASFVKAHKGLFKKMGFKAASRKIASMWRHK